MRFADQKAQHLYLYDFEFAYLQSNNLLDERFASTAKKYTYPYRGHELSFYMVKCGYGGACPRHEFRPLSCFLYPYMPYFDENGTVTKLYNHSIYDDIYEVLDEKKPCTLYSSFTPANYQNLADSFFCDPVFYFYTNLFVRFKEKVIEAFAKQSQARDFADSLADLEAIMMLRRYVTPAEAERIVDEENEKFKVFAL